MPSGEHFPLYAAGVAAWILLWLAGSVIYRLSRGKTILTPRPDDTLFWESRATGCSHRTLFTRIAGARNCLQVAVTHSELIVRPMFPLNLFFLPEVFGIEATIPRGEVRTLRAKRRLFSYKPAVVVEFIRPDGVQEMFELLLNDPQAFARALGRGLEDY